MKKRENLNYRKAGKRENCIFGFLLDLQIEDPMKKLENKPVGTKLSKEVFKETF